MYRMAIMSFLFDSKDGIDSTKVMKISLVHDMAESIVGDITPSIIVESLKKISIIERKMPWLILHL